MALPGKFNGTDRRTRCARRPWLTMQNVDITRNPSRKPIHGLKDVSFLYLLPHVAGIFVKVSCSRRTGFQLAIASARQQNLSGPTMQSIEDVKNILADTLNLGERKKFLNADSGLLGSIPELDSMAVINVITALEEHFDIIVEDDEISGRTFETLGSLAAFIDSKIAK
jgi:acyl carrier protein